MARRSPREALPPPPPGSAILLCPDGVYRWVFELPMYRNPSILFSVWKVLGLSAGLVWLFTAVLSLAENGFDAGEQLALLRVFLLVYAGVGIVLGCLAYLILAALYGGRYCVLFEMDGSGVRHIQQPLQFKKAQVLGALTAFAGAVQGAASAAGAGLLAASRGSISTDFAKVKHARASRKRSAIYLNELLLRNQIYAEPQDFDFVLGFIRARIPAHAAAELAG